MTDEYRKALADLDVIFCGMDETLVNRIPRKFPEFIHENKMPEEDYTSTVKLTVPLEQQTLQPSTQGLLALLYGCYLVKDEAERDDLVRKIQANSPGSSEADVLRDFDDILQLFPKED